MEMQRADSGRAFPVTQSMWEARTQSRDNASRCGMSSCFPTWKKWCIEKEQGLPKVISHRSEFIMDTASWRSAGARTPDSRPFEHIHSLYREALLWCSSITLSLVWWSENNHFNNDLKMMPVMCVHYRKTKTIFKKKEENKNHLWFYPLHFSVYSFRHFPWHFCSIYIIHKYIMCFL